MELQVDNQVVATAETRTPNLYRAKTSLSRVRMERMASVATRREKNLVEQKTKRILLIPTGLLMEGHFAH
jgi:hypothetical protein